MAHTLSFDQAAADTLRHLEKHNKPKYKKVRKALGFLELDTRHPSLNTHVWESQTGPKGEKVWEAYAENHTAGAYRIFFFYPKGEPGVIRIRAITPHPK